jgi:hypothetical protein
MRWNGWSFRSLIGWKTTIAMITNSSTQASVPTLPNISHLNYAEKDALVLPLWQRLGASEGQIAEWEAK